MAESTSTPNQESTVSLREITAKTVNKILDLDVAESQQNFVAPNSYSIAQAHYSEHAWFRAIYADEMPIGFVMLHDQPDGKDGPRYYLWRFMIDQRYQKMGFGRQAVDLLIDYVKTRPNAKELFVTYIPEEGGPKVFYEKIGFEHTGKKHGDEVELKLEL